MERSTCVADAANWGNIELADTNPTYRPLPHRCESHITSHSRDRQINAGKYVGYRPQYSIRRQLLYCALGPNCTVGRHFKRLNLTSIVLIAVTAFSCSKQPLNWPFQQVPTHGACASFADCNRKNLLQALCKGKGKGSVYGVNVMEFHLTATGCHLPYGITQCYLPPNTSEHTLPCTCRGAITPVARVGLLSRAWKRDSIYLL